MERKYQLVMAETEHLTREVAGTDELKAEEGDRPRAPVFVLSPAPRSGTNFLADLVQLDPAFQIPNLVWEDHVLVHSDLLEQYVNRTSRRWAKEIRDSERYRRRLLMHLGEGILSFLGEQVEQNKRILCKTPRAHNIDNFFLLFPKARLLVLIRDGRDVVDSATRTWPNRVFAFARSARTWAQGARRVLDFMHGPNHDMRGSSWELVTYESLVDQPQTVLQDIQGVAGISTATLLDVSRIEKLPLRGSSVHRGGKGEVHWSPLEKPQDFRPVGRWKSWGFLRKMTFKIIAGRELIRLGYADNNHW